MIAQLSCDIAVVTTPPSNNTLPAAKAVVYLAYVPLKVTVRTMVRAVAKALVPAVKTAAPPLPSLSVRAIVGVMVRRITTKVAVVVSSARPTSGYVGT